MAWSARAQIAALAGGLTAIAVVGAQVPFALQSEGQIRTLNAEAVAAALAGDIDVQDQDDLARLGRHASLSAGALLGPDGQTLASFGPLDDDLSSACPGTAPVGLALPLGSSHSDGVDRYGACVQLDDGRTLLAFRSARGWRESGRHRQMLLFALLFGGLAGAVVAATVRKLLEPLDEMREAATKLASGERVAIPQGRSPELQALSEALAGLGQALQSRDDDIELRLEIVRELGAVVAHEVRNPLQSITMLADIVAHSEDPDERRRVLRDIQTELGGIEQVIHRLVAADGELHLVRRDLRVGDIPKRVARILAPTATASGVVIAMPRAEPVRAWIDGPLVRRAVENLVHNAIAVLSESGGTQVQITVAETPTGCLIAVDDDGPGVPEDDRERIFEAGWTARSGGTGLGLPLARKVADAHGGTLTVHSSSLGGARFELRLPSDP